jgi:cell division protein FtsI (penicillin-binding protein 3)
LASWREVELADHGFGQGVAVTPIQLVTAYAAIANGGAVMRPYVVKAAYDVNGQQVLVHTPQALRRAVSPAVAHKMNQLLRGVVNGRDGTAHLAQVADLTVAGKTGTAQMVDPVTGKYYRNRLVASFVGFLPADDPRLVILVVLYDVPRGHFGGLVAAPVFSKIASDAVQLLSVTPAHPVVEAAGLFPSASSLPDLIGPSRNSDSGDSLNRAAEGEGEHSALRYAPLDPVDNSSEAGRHVPDFRGLSLRSALALARVHKLALEVSGDGYVMRQEPAPDAMLARWGAMPGPSAGEQPRGAVRILLTSDVASGGQAGPPARHAASRVKDRLARRLRSRR